MQEEEFLNDLKNEQYLGIIKRVIDEGS